jgi:glycerol uptake facilitator-like aquaporin
MTESEKITLPTPVAPTKKYLAELIGTMVLVLMGCGSAVMWCLVRRNSGNLFCWSFGSSYGLRNSQFLDAT